MLSKLAKKLIGLNKKHYTRIFSVEFIKRTNGKLRRLTGRFGVRKGITGVGLPFNPKDYDLLSVYDFQKRAFRFISLENIKSVKMNGRDYR